MLIALVFAIALGLVFGVRVVVLFALATLGFGVACIGGINLLLSVSTVKRCIWAVAISCALITLVTSLARIANLIMHSALAT